MHTITLSHYAERAEVISNFNSTNEACTIILLYKEVLVMQLSRKKILDIIVITGFINVIIVFTGFFISSDMCVSYLATCSLV